MNRLANDTICAICTPPGCGAMAIIRISGEQSFAVVERLFSKPLQDKASHTLHFGRILDGEKVIDEVVVSLFRAPHSFTGEDVIELTCHGSVYIQQRLIQLLLAQGCRMAQHGEFTQRAFLNGKMDLAQAESILDLIHAQSESQHRLAMDQMKGHFSKMIKALRGELIRFAALIELELDFSTEDVEFADRSQLFELFAHLKEVCAQLMASYQTGAVLKRGIPVAIIGAPNAGKSTLLNALLGEERALVSDIPGTTRDAIEDTLNIDGVLFRIIDTAGIRETQDVVENLGIEKSLAAAQKAQIILYVVDATNPNLDTLQGEVLHGDVETLHAMSLRDKTIFVVYNKIDLGFAAAQPPICSLRGIEGTIQISAQNKIGLADLQQRMAAWAKQRQQTGEFMVSSLRHYEALERASRAVLEVEAAFRAGLPSDLIAVHLRDILNALGEITGEISNDDLLDKIFREFCIGK